MTPSLAGDHPPCEGREDHVASAVRVGRRILLRASDESRMLHDICDALVDGGVCTTAWIGLVLEDGDTLHPAARAGQGGVLAALDSHLAAGELGCGSTATALRTARTVVVGELEQTTAAELEPFRARMSDDGFRQSRRQAMYRLVRQHFGLPSI